MTNRKFIQESFEQGKGILHMRPAWVPRGSGAPGKRIGLHPDDYYALGIKRGAIIERWMSSTTHASNGPDTPEDEGMSYLAKTDQESPDVLLEEAVNELKGELIGEELWNECGRWPMFSKFFDDMRPLPHHVHHDEAHAVRVGQHGKPEMYFFPSQLNNHVGLFPHTYFGLNQDVTKEELKKTLEKFGLGDNKILELSHAYKLALDTGWDVPPGILHAPGSLCTYEPQGASDDSALYQSVLCEGTTIGEDLLWKDSPKSEEGNYDYLIEVLDWAANLDSRFKENHFMLPKPVRPVEEMEAEGYCEEWIGYKSSLVGAKRLTVFPGRSVRITDPVAYGLIIIQGHGSCNGLPLEKTTAVRYGEQTADEYFVSKGTAEEGVTFVNGSMYQPMVILKHYALPGGWAAEAK